MTVAEGLVTLLREERAAILACDWEKIGEFAEQKSSAIEQLEAPISSDIAALIERKAEENSRLLGVMRDAVASLRLRFAGMALRAASIGYGEDGNRLSLSIQDQLRRV